MRVYLLGYFHAGAIADDIIEDITKQLFLEVDPETIIMDKKSHPHPTNGKAVADFFNENCDLVVFCGGSLLGRLRLSPFNCIEQWAEHLKVPLIIFGTGWRDEAQPLTEEELQRMNLLCKTAKYIGVRGEHSKKHLEANGMGLHRIEVLGDPGLAFKSDNKKYNQVPKLIDPDNTILRGNREEYFVGAVIRQMSPIEIEQDQNTITNEEFYGRIGRIFDYVAGVEGGDIFFFPFATQGRLFDNDHKAFYELKKYVNPEFHDKLHLCYGENMAEALGWMDFVISQRLHGTLVSIAQGIPCLPIEYQFGKLADSLSVEGFEHSRDMITPMKDVSLEKYLEARKQEAEGVMGQALFSKMAYHCSLFLKIKLILGVVKNGCRESLYRSADP